MPTRRQFLRHCSALAVTASVAPAALGVCPASPLAPLERLSFTAFAAQLGTVFRARTGAVVAVPLILAEATVLRQRTSAPARAAATRYESFALRFSGPPALPLAQGTYQFEHPALGPFAMFITRVGPERPSGPAYEAIFNRLAGTSRASSQPEPS